MRRKLIITTITITALFAPVLTTARILDSGRTNVAQGQTVNDDVYIAGDAVTIAGTVNGDVYVAAKTATITGTVTGDVFVAAQDVRVSGVVKGSVRTVGATAKFDHASIAGSVSEFGQSLTIDSHSTIGGGLNFAVASATINAPIERGITAAGSTIAINSRVGKDVTVTAQHASLGDGARIAGGVTTYNNTQLERASGSKVGAAIRQYQGHQFGSLTHRTHVLQVIWGVLALYVLGAALLWLAPTRLIMAAAAARRQAGLSAIWGVGVMLLIIPVVAILAISLIGLSLAGVALIGFAVALYLCKFVIGLSVGSYIAEKAQWKPNPYADAFVGLILLTILEVIPVIGGLVKIVILIIGLGSIARSLRPQQAKTKA